MFADAIMGHLVGDYLLQNDGMAQGKKESTWICLLHSWIWASCVVLFAGISENLPVYFALIGSHFIQDRWQLIPWWMKTVGQPEFVKPPMAPWSIIVVDNVFHLLTIWLLLKFFVHV